MENENELLKIYNNFKAPKSEMDNKQFAKMTRDTKILDGNLNDIKCDIVFAKNQNRVNKKLDFQAFEQVVNTLASLKKCTCTILI